MLSLVGCITQSFLLAVSGRETRALAKLRRTDKFGDLLTKGAFLPLFFFYTMPRRTCAGLQSQVFLGDRQAAASVSSSVNDAAIGDTSAFISAVPLEPNAETKTHIFLPGLMSCSDYACVLWCDSHANLFQTRLRLPV